jgi:hypothetical protein
MTACSEFFERHSVDKDKVKALSVIGDRFDWERNQTASVHSPGLVADTEIICRQLHSPIYIDASTGKLKPTAFDDISNKGFSTDRLAHSSAEAIVESGRSRASHYNATCADESKRRSLIALAHLECSAIRNHRVAGGQALGIYDTAMSENIAHADLCAMFVDKQSLRSSRAFLFDLARVELLAQ